MVMEFIGFIQGIHTLGNGLTGRVMVLECRLVQMGVAMLVNSSVPSNMALVFTISGDFCLLEFKFIYLNFILGCCILGLLF
jgi:hypothetical protein